MQLVQFMVEPEHVAHGAVQPTHVRVLESGNNPDGQVDTHSFADAK